ncbi:MAG: hypothetical protein JW993_07665 [Sedimentisphaerales bacterium]|nr:hypothetical protein [Sedimentisphaerales bacterium]
MLRSLKGLSDFSIGATDEEIGKVHSFLFDSKTWVIRYLVADTGRWLPGRKVLIAVSALGQPNWEGRVFPVSLTKEQVKKAPGIDTDKPVSRQREIELHQYYSWAPYWAGYGVPLGGTPVSPPVDPEEAKEAAKGDPSLRSTREVKGYYIHAADGQIGHVEDFIAGDEDWVIRYLVVDTRNWLPGRSVLVSPQWVRQVSWDRQEVVVDAAKETVKNCPTYNPSAPVNREYEIQLYDYYGRPKYWV